MFVSIITLNNKLIRLNIESVLLIDSEYQTQIVCNGLIFDVDRSVFERIKKLTSRYNSNKLKNEDYLCNGMIDEFYKI